MGKNLDGFMQLNLSELWRLTIAIDLEKIELEAEKLIQMKQSRPAEYRDMLEELKQLSVRQLQKYQTMLTCVLSSLPDDPETHWKLMFLHLAIVKETRELQKLVQELKEITPDLLSAAKEILKG